MKKNQKEAAIGFIFITMLIDITGWGIIIPVIPKLISELINADISEAAKYGGWLTFAYAITQFIFAPLIGNLSDKFGRRPIILISLFAFSILFVVGFCPDNNLAFCGKNYCRINRCKYYNRFRIYCRCQYARE
jgi:DHA1 family tetracycline resistance protein-like MFS transporter